MKKMHEAPEAEVFELEGGPMLIKGSGIDMGGEGDPDAKERLEELMEEGSSAPLW